MACPFKHKGTIVPAYDVRALFGDSGRLELWDEMPVAAYLRTTTHPHKILYVNPALTELLDYASNELVGRSVCCLFANHRKGELCGIVNQAEQDIDLIRSESEFRAKDDRNVYVELTRHHYDTEGISTKKSGKPTALALIFVHDITPAKMRDMAFASFASVVSHETNTPLNAIIGFIQILCDSGELSAMHLKYARYILGAGQYLRDLLARELYCTRHGVRELYDTPVSLEVPCALVVGMLTSPAAKKGVVLGCTISPGLRITGDTVAIIEIIENLMRNAIEHTSTGGAVNLDGSLVDGSVVITVSDTGIGIAPEYHSLIFDLHVRVDANRAGGQGLGLALVKKNIEALGGMIVVTSELGKGSTFTIRFPSTRTVR